MKTVIYVFGDEQHLPPAGTTPQPPVTPEERYVECRCGRKYSDQSCPPCKKCGERVCFECLPKPVDFDDYLTAASGASDDEQREFARILGDLMLFSETCEKHVLEVILRL
jgi:hypothetical protein